HALRRTHRALRKHIPPGISIVSRVGVDETTHRAVLRGDFWFYVAARSAVLRDADRAAHRDAATFELLVIGGDAVVHEDERGGDVAVTRGGVVRRELLGVLTRRWIDRDGGLLELRLVCRRRHELDHTLQRS